MSDFVGNMERARMAEAVAKHLISGDERPVPIENLRILARRFIERGQIIEALRSQLGGGGTGSGGGSVPTDTHGLATRGRSMTDEVPVSGQREASAESGQRAEVGARDLIPANPTASSGYCDKHCDTGPIGPEVTSA